MRSIILNFVFVEDKDGKNEDNIWTIPPKRMALLGFYRIRNQTNIIFFLISIIHINHASLILRTKSWADQLHRWISSNRLPSSLLPCPSCPTIASIHSSTSINTSFICNSPTCVTLQQNHPCPGWAMLTVELRSLLTCYYQLFDNKWKWNLPPPPPQSPAIYLNSQIRMFPDRFYLCLWHSESKIFFLNLHSCGIFSDFHSLHFYQAN